MMSRSTVTLLGLVNTILLARSFGSTFLVDAFFVAQIFPVGISVAVRTAIDLSLIPAFSRDKETLGEKDAWRAASNFFIFLVIVFLAGSVGLFVFAPQLVKLLAPGFGTEAQEVCTRLLRILAPVFFLSSFGASLESIFHAYRRFMVPALGIIMIPLGTTFGLVALSGKWGMDGVVAGLTGGAILQLVVLLASLVSFRKLFVLRFRLTDPTLKKILLQLGAAILGTLIIQINLAVDAFFASGLGEGKIAALRYAGTLIVVGPNIIIMSIMAVLFPSLARQHARAETARFRDTLEKAIRSIGFFTIPFTFAVIVMSRPLIRLFLEHGAFDAHATNMTATALAYYSIGIIAICANMTLKGGLFALGQGPALIRIGAICIVANAIGDYVLCRFLDHGGIALTTSIVVFLQWFLQGRLMRRLMGPVLPRVVWAGFAKIVLGSGIMTAAMVLFHRGVSFTWSEAGPAGLLAQIGTFSIIGLAVFALSVYVLRIKEPSMIKGILWERRAGEPGAVP